MIKLGLKDNISYEYHCTIRIRFLKIYLIYKHKPYAKGRHGTGTDHSIEQVTRNELYDFTL